MKGGKRARGKVDYSHEVRHHESRVVRVLYLGAGLAFVALGVLGLFLPVLPTTPFLLLAAACFARASSRFYNWLLNNPLLGPTILEWRRHRSIPYRTKVAAIVLMTLTLAVSVVFFVKDAYLQWVLGALGLLLAAWLYSVPSRDRPRK